MHTVTKRNHSSKHLQKNMARYADPRLTQQLEKIYSRSLKTIKKRPFQTTGVLLGLSAISAGIFVYFRYIK